jgi:thiamine pyrophosphate-dependent acetolactate synthase large subunit-like protein
MTKVDGGELLARTLAQAGATDVFALHGGHLDSFLQGCRRNGVRLIDTRHEATAGHAAEAYARTTGRVGVCAVTAGPGFTNAYTAMANAYLDAVPVLFITSSPPLREVELNVLQGGFDQVAAAAPVTKWGYRVTHPERIPDLVALAMRRAYGGRPGPVLLDFPIDVFFTPLDERLATRPTAFNVQRPAPAPAELEQALGILRQAKRPALVLGGGTLFPPCNGEVRALADKTAIPVYTTGKAHGMLPPDHPSYCGGAGGLAALAAAGSPPDVVVLLGARQGLYTGGRSRGIIPSEAKLIQVDIDPAEVGRIHPAQPGIAAGCRETLAAMLAGGEAWPDWSDWRRQAGEAARGVHALLSSLPTTGQSGRLHPLHAAKAVFDAIGPEAIVSIDAGEAGAWAGAFSRSAVPGGVLTNGYLGALGVGFGFAVGARVAHPDRRVVQIAGDGAFGFHLQEVDTMVRHKLPVVNVVFNNACWGMSIHGQEAIFGRGAGVISTLNDSDYEKVAVALGGYGERVGNFEEIGPAMQRSFDSGLPAVINLEIAPEVIHPIMNAMVGPPAVSTDVVIPYYENIPTLAEEPVSAT